MNQVEPIPKDPKPSKSLVKAYNAWLHQNGTCCLTGYTIFENAHTGGLEDGKGTGRKAALKTILPIRRELHLASEGRNDEFFTAAGIPDYKAYASDLFDAFEAGQSPAMILAEMQALANREFIISILLSANGPRQIDF